MSMARIFFVFLMLFLLNTANAFATPRDIQYHWAGTEINTLLENGIMQGYDDGRFKPSRYITREEASALFVSLAMHQGFISDKELRIESKVRLSDVKNQWSRNDIHFMNRTGILKTDAAGLFCPDAKLTREAMAALIYNYYKQFHLTFGSTEKKVCPFTDIANSAAKNQIIELYKNDLIQGFEDNTYQPEAYVTRGEAAALLFKISGLQPIPPEITLPKYNVIPAAYISQVYPVSAPVGCEATSLLMGLHAKGYAMRIGLREFLDDLPRHTSNPEKGFVGSPYKPDKTKRTRTTILPNALSSWAAKYGDVSDFSGSSAEEISAELLDGNPVVVYATLWWEKPYYRVYNIEGHYEQMLSNNHVILACGYDMKNNLYYIADPYNLKDPSKDLKYWIDGDTFERIYNARKHAVVVE